MKAIPLYIIALMALGCSQRTHTGKLWNKVDEYVVIEARYLTEQQVGFLKSKVGEKVKYDGIDRFYVQKTIVERMAIPPMIILITPFTVAMDGVTWFVSGIFDLKDSNSYNAGVPDRLAVSAIECIINAL